MMIMIMTMAYNSGNHSNIDNSDDDNDDKK